MIGLAQPLQLRGRPAEAYGPSMSTPINPVIGIICSGDLAVHRNEVKAAISRGLAERPDAVWVCIEPRSDRMTHDLMISLDIEPVVLPMNPAWKKSGGQEGIVNHGAGEDGPQSADPAPVPSYDLRRQWRDLEMLHLCDELVIFHKASGSSPWRDRVKSGIYSQRLYLVEIGPSKKPKASAVLRTRP